MYTRIGRSPLEQISCGHYPQQAPRCTIEATCEVPARLCAALSIARRPSTSATLSICSALAAMTRNVCFGEAQSEALSTAVGREQTPSVALKSWRLAGAKTSHPGAAFVRGARKYSRAPWPGLAERVGFEPTNPVRGLRFSSLDTRGSGTHAHVSARVLDDSQPAEQRCRPAFQRPVQLDRGAHSLTPAGTWEPSVPVSSRGLALGWTSG
jgi:hypothetical protein